MRLRVGILMAAGLVPLFLFQNFTYSTAQAADFGIGNYGDFSADPALPTLVPGPAISDLVYVVTSNADEDVAGTLRHAINNANVASSLNRRATIQFSLGTQSGPICPKSALPIIARPVRIVGEQSSDQPLALVTEISGSCLPSAQPASGLVVTANQVTISHLVIRNFPLSGIELRRSHHAVIVGNRIGTDVTGEIRQPNMREGLLIDGGSGHLIGALGDDNRNVISGNGPVTSADEDPDLIKAANDSVGHGVRVVSGSTGNVFVNNYVGTNAAGTRALPNLGNGFFILQAPRNFIGSSIPGAGNLISGNLYYGITVTGDLSGHHLIRSNIIGLDAKGATAIPNRTGINLHDTAYNVIGGNAPNEGNVVSGNRRHGLNIDGAEACLAAAYKNDPYGNKGFNHHNKIYGNKIGTDITGTIGVGNGHFGILVYRGHDIQIGGSRPYGGNVISGNGKPIWDSPASTATFDGIMISGLHDEYPDPAKYNYTLENLISMNILVLNNNIGTSADGSAPIPNQGSGVSILQTQGVDIRQNQIKFNMKDGIKIAPDDDASTVKISPNNTIVGNLRRQVN